MSDAGKAASQLAEEVRNQQAQVQGALREQQAAAAALQQELNVALQRGGELQSQLAAADGKVGGLLLLQPAVPCMSSTASTSGHSQMADRAGSWDRRGLRRPCCCTCKVPVQQRMDVSRNIRAC